MMSEDDVELAANLLVGETEAMLRHETTYVFLGRRLVRETELWLEATEAQISLAVTEAEIWSQTRGELPGK